MRDQRRRNILLLGLLIALMVVLAYQKFYSPGQPASVQADIFTVADTSAVDSVVLQNEQFLSILHEKDTGWLINDQYPLAPRPVVILKSILKSVEPQYKVVGDELKTIKSRMDNQGTAVVVFGNEKQLTAFISVGDSSRTKSYFQDPNTGAIYRVNIPGYNAYIAGMFEPAGSESTQRPQ